MRRIHACTCSSACPWKLSQTSFFHLTSEFHLTSIHFGSYMKWFTRVSHYKTFLMSADTYIPIGLLPVECILKWRLILVLLIILAQTGQLIVASFCFFGNNHGTWLFDSITWWGVSMSDGVYCYRSLSHVSLKASCAIRMRLRLTVSCGIRLRLCLTASRVIRMRLYEINRNHQIHEWQIGI